MKVTVYTKPDCPQCTWTKKQLDKDGVTYQSLDVTADDEAMAAMRAIVGHDGPVQMPVVVVSTDQGTRTAYWCGLRTVKLKGLKDTGGY